MKRALILFGCALTLAATTQAVEIRNVTTGTQLFYDDFERPVVTPSTNNAYDGTVDANPIPEVGTWTVSEAPNVGIVQVTTYTNPPAAPVPFQGSRDLRVYRDSSHQQHDLIANMTNPQITPGDLIHLSMWVYIPSSQNADARGTFLLVGSPPGNLTNVRAAVRPNGAGFVNVFVPTGVAPTTVPYLTDTWQEWSLDYAVNATTFRFSVGGVSGSALSRTSGDVYGAEFVNGNDFPGSFFLDVPEPTTATFLVLGGLTLWRTRRRSRMEQRSTGAIE